jgi:hypothetical protein
MASPPAVSVPVSPNVQAAVGVAITANNAKKGLVTKQGDSVLAQLVAGGLSCMISSASMCCALHLICCCTHVLTDSNTRYGYVYVSMISV